MWKEVGCKTDGKKEMVSEICGCQEREAEMKGQCLQMRTKTRAVRMGRSIENHMGLNWN